MKLMTLEKAAGRQRGFTLVELMVAMGLLSAMGALLVQLTRGSFELYEQGDVRGDLYANALPILELLESDLRAVHSGPDGRMLLITEGVGGGKGRGDGFFLRLVRTIPGGEMEHPILRNSGTGAEPENSYSGADPGITSRKDLAPPSGLMEVAYALIQEPSDPEGILTLYRGERAPALSGEDSYFASGTADTMDEAWARKTLRPVATDILGLWILCYGQNADEWGEANVLNGTTGGASLASRTWDSTRGILDQADFPLAVGSASLAEPRDDIYPRIVRVVLQVARGRTPDAFLREVSRPDESSIAVNSTDRFPDEESEDRYMKIGREWMFATSWDKGEVYVERKRRRTRAAAENHATRTPVFLGKTFRKTLRIPAARSWWTAEEK